MQFVIRVACPRVPVEIAIVEIEPIDVVTRKNSTRKPPISTKHPITDLPGFQGNDGTPRICLIDQVGASLKPVFLHESEHFCRILLLIPPDTAPESKPFCYEIQRRVWLQRITVPINGTGKLRGLF